MMKNNNDFKVHDSYNQERIRYLKNIIKRLLDRGEFKKAEIKLMEYKDEFGIDDDICSLDSMTLIMKGQWEEAEDYLLKNIEENIYNLNLLYNLMYIYKYYDFKNTEKVYNVIEKNIQELTHTGRVGTVEIFKQLYNTCSSNGFIRLGGIMRNKAIEVAYLNKLKHEVTASEFFDIYKAAIDQGDFKTAFEAINSLKEYNVPKEIMNDILYFYYLNKGDLENLKKISKNKLTEKDYKYFDYINGKTVAIVGPAMIEDNNSEEIDTYDIVIRFNYRGDEYLTKEIFGNKTDVSYYNVENARTISSYKNHDFFNNVDYTIFKSIEQNFQKELMLNNKGRQVIFSNHMAFSGHYNMVQITLYDILHFNPKNVKIFNTNFLLAEKTHDEKYNIQKEMGIEEKWNSYASHDLLTQLNFIKNVWNGGIVSVDNDCRRVLELSNYEYLKGIEKIYVKDIYKDNK